MIRIVRAAKAPAIVACMAAMGFSPATVAQTTGNEAATLSYIAQICPRMGAIRTTLNSGQTELYRRCNSVLRATDANEKNAALGQITSDELLAQDAAIRGAAQAQTGAIAGRLSAMSHFSTQSMGTAMLWFPTQFANSDAIQSDGTADYGLGSPSPLQFFSNVSHSGGDRDASSQETGFDMQFTSVVVGADYRFSPEFVAGLALGYGKTKLDFDESGGDLDSRAYTVALYAMIQPAERFEVSLLAAYSRVRYRGARTLDYSVATGPNAVVQPADVVDGTADSRTHANQSEVSISTFYNLGDGAWTVGPVAQLSWASLSIDGFAESNANGLGYRFADQKSDSLQLAIGLDASKAISTSWGILSPYTRARAIVETADRQRTTRIFYVNDPFVANGTSPGATLTTSPTDRTRFSLAAGIAAQLPGGVALTVEGQTLVGMRNVSQYGVMAGLRFAL